MATSKRATKPTKRATKPTKRATKPTKLAAKGVASPTLKPTAASVAAVAVSALPRWGRRFMALAPKVKANRLTGGPYKASAFFVRLGTVPSVYTGQRASSALDCSVALHVAAALGLTWPKPLAADPPGRNSNVPPNLRNWVSARLWHGLRRPLAVTPSAVSAQDLATINKLAKQARKTLSKVAA